MLCKCLERYLIETFSALVELAVVGLVLRAEALDGDLLGIEVGVLQAHVDEGDVGGQGAA